MSVTIYDVAEHAKVSISTVSRVLNTPQNVNEDTRQRVLNSIDALNFVPKAEASARARKVTNRIGVLAPFFTFVPSFLQRLRGVAVVLADTPYELVVYNAQTAQHVRGYLESLPVSQRLDGLIVMSMTIEDSIATRLLEHNLQTVMVETSHPLLSGVSIDNRLGGKIAAFYLVARGHQRIGFVGGDMDTIPGFTTRTSNVRLEGFRQGLAEKGIELSPSQTKLGSHEMQRGYLLACELLQQPDAPTAIFAATDTLAMGVLKAARTLGRRVPEDLAVIGFDDIDVADYAGLTTVSQSLEESGRVATELLLARMVDSRRAIQQVQLSLSVVERQST